MTSVKHLLIIGTVWPEPKSSAAGSRMLQLIDLFLDAGFKITFACPSLKTEHAFDLGEKNISCFTVKVNDSGFDVWVKEINPTHVMFDRFMIEEQFGWRIAENCPSAIRILDTEDLHCLRKTRQDCFKRKQPFTIDQLKLSEITKREIASILRSHISIMISKIEADILINHFSVPASKIFYLPFLAEERKESFKPFEERNHFMTIGSFRHEPNVDSVLYLKKDVWPLIRKQLPTAELHIYGSYPKQKVTQLNNVKEGFLIKGWAESSKEVIENAKVMLAPLRFGAGQKGKFLEALTYGTPSVTTSIGAEGMGEKKNWSGYITDSPKEIAEKAIELYLNKTEWEHMQNRASKLLKTQFSKSNFVDTFKQMLEKTELEPLPFYVEALNYHSFRNARFMSKWIEEKNKN